MWRESDMCVNERERGDFENIIRTSVSLLNIGTGMCVSLYISIRMCECKTKQTIPLSLLTAAEEGTEWVFLLSWRAQWIPPLILYQASKSKKMMEEATEDSSFWEGTEWIFFLSYEELLHSRCKKEST